MAVPPEIRAMLENVDWSFLTKKLLIYAFVKVHGYSLPGGWSHDDVVQNAIMKLHAWKWQWNPRKVALFQFLCRGIARDLPRIWEEPSSLTTAICEEPGADFPDVAIAHEQQKRAILNAVSATDRPIVALVLAEESYTPKDIAERLQIPVQAVYKCRQRLRSRFAGLCPGRQRS